jgi:hypothetical protein
MKVKLILMLILSACLAACAGKTSISGNWEDEKVRGQKFKNVLVVTLARESSRRQQFNSELVGNLTGVRSTAIAASSLLDPKTKITRPVVKELVIANNFDGVIVTRVTEQRVVPKEITSKTDAASYRNTGQAYGEFETGNAFNFVQYDYKSDIDTKDYTVANYNLVLSTEVYETNDGKMIYRIESTAENQRDVSKMINTLAKKITKQLRRTQLVDQ